MLARAALLAALSATLAAAIGCTNDFAVFTPVADGGVGSGDDAGGDASRTDGSSGGNDAQPDVACTPDPTCLSAARSCSQNCPQGQRHQQCVSQCQQTCVSCTQRAGCSGSSDCSAAVR